MNFWPQTLVDWAQIASAIGTCGAVAMSLWLAQRKPRPDLSVTANMRVLIWGDGRQEMPKFLVIEVVNKGEQPVRVLSINWKVRRRFRPGYVQQAAFQIVDTTAAYVPNPKLPATLDQGQELSFYFAAEGEYDWFRTARADGFFPHELTSRKSLERLRVSAYTSVGVSCVGRPSSEFLDELWVAIHHYRANAGLR